jgi:transposase
LEWLPEGHLAYFILDVLVELDLSEIENAIQNKDARGTRPFSPYMMTTLLLYAYCVGVVSSRKIERALVEDVAFRVLAGGEQPHFTSINQFRKNHLTAFKELFVQVLHLCQKAGLVKLGQIAVDGTKMEANASKHKAMSYEYMGRREEQLVAEVDELLERAKQVDEEEDARFGEGQREEDLPEEMRRREARLAKIREAKVALEAEALDARAAVLREQADKARQAATTAATEPEQKRAERRAEAREEKASALVAPEDAVSFETPEGLPKHRPRTRSDGTPHPKAQRNFTDPDSRVMQSGGAFLQGYNCQAAVDEAHQIIVAQAVTNQPPDNGNLLPLLRQTQANCGAAPEVVTADAGYWSPDVPDACTQETGTDVLIAVERRKHWKSDPQVTSGPPPDDATPKESMSWKLRTEEGRAAYARRKAIVEPVFGQIKEARGLRRLLLRGLEKVSAEWSLICMGHNLLKLFRAETLAS